ncbi:hypothetical protein ACT7C3_23590 [Bacillus pacificus]
MVTKSWWDTVDSIVPTFLGTIFFTTSRIDFCLYSKMDCIK